jgi:hypothetical protein
MTLDEARATQPFVNQTFVDCWSETIDRQEAPGTAGDEPIPQAPNHDDDDEKARKRPQIVVVASSLPRATVVSSLLDG